MFVTGQLAAIALIHWILLVFVAAYVPAIARRAKLDDKIDAHMTSVIRGVIIAYLAISVLGVAAVFGASLVPSAYHFVTPF